MRDRVKQFKSLVENNDVQGNDIVALHDSIETMVIKAEEMIRALTFTEKNLQPIDDATLIFEIKKNPIMKKKLFSLLWYYQSVLNKLDISIFELMDLSTERSEEKYARDEIKTLKQSLASNIVKNFGEKMDFYVHVNKPKEDRNDHFVYFQYMKSEGTQFEYPFGAPELNHSEWVWSYLKSALRKFNPIIRLKRGLRRLVHSTLARLRLQTDKLKGLGMGVKVKPEVLIC